jgi:translation initiation factor IF-2
MAQNHTNENINNNTVIFKDGMTVKELAESIGKGVASVIKKLMGLGVMANANQVLDFDTVELIASEFNMSVELEKVTDLTRFEEIVIEDKEEDLVERPPVVTIMGHVDHGKTTLLDTIRNANVTSTEAGGITQHIGAYQVEKNGKLVSFIDTPGHAAFTEMRSRGAQVTDITVLVVAADDGVMPQTIEAIDHAKAADVPIIVAVNKMDVVGANPDRVTQELAELNILSEEWGGDTIFCKISALKNEGIDHLLEMIQLVSEMNEYKANPNRDALGTVIESKLDKGRGPVATLLIKNGTLKVGDVVVCGNTFGKIRAMVDEYQNRLEFASPSKAVEITGLNDVPEAGDAFMVINDEKKARQISENRSHKQKEKDMNQSTSVSLEALFGNGEESKELNLILKGDTHGSIEALKSSLEKIDIEGANIQVIRSQVGTVTETDVTLALASKAIIIGFNVRPSAAVRNTAKDKNVEIRLYNIIYKALEDIELATKGLLDPEMEEVVTGQAEVRDTFKISKVGTIAGCYVTDGTINRSSLVRVIRNGIVVYEGKLASLKRFKDDVKDVRQGYECGIMIEKFNDIKEGDIIEASIEREASNEA